MKRALVTQVCLVLALCLAAQAAIAGECKPINVRVGPSTYLDPCTYNGMDFEFCIDAPLRGTLRGTWHYYGPADNFVEWSDVVNDPPVFSPFWAGWALDVIETNRGEIWAQDNYLFNLNVMGNKAGFPFVAISSITGGTGHYEGAWGWFGTIADDAGGWRGFMRGEICTP